MLLTPDRPQVFREYRVTSDQAEPVAKAVVASTRTLHERGVGCQEWAVHLSHDRLRVVTVEAWRDAAAYHRFGHDADLPHHTPDTALYEVAGTSGADPTPVGNPSIGVTVIDIFRVWRPLIRPVSAFNLRNGSAFTRRPGCVSTTVLRGRTAGRIATYARWRSTEDVLAAFTATQGAAVDSTDAVNAAIARTTRGLVRTDYHAYDLVDSASAGAEPR